MRYITKPNKYFDAGTEATMLGESWEVYADYDEICPCRVAVFQGIKDGKPDEEVCSVDEFDIVE